ncbi:Low-density lipoprotein receptor class A domain-containing protein 3-like [Homarus americanus]|uniref:Low-density lipoprotein receptor class A domain-containing protein 3-like n=1 Tax=Homarus americanus TaxID=6706 RepID=A0A8J5MMX2_HOMAM|nr:Low-density lipoprotein receptor class A domain-containing protein 3-like [Homarus americanus]
MTLHLLLLLSLTTTLVYSGRVYEDNDECFQGYFQCANGVCVPNYVVCDGVLNCVTGSDEVNCTLSKGDCFDGYFQCADGVCVPNSVVCDGVFNCVTGNDEANCSCKYLLCTLFICILFIMHDQPL